jgi:hypothetical protein
MRPHVHSQVAGAGKRLAARLADMRLLPRMRGRVLSQLAWVRKGFCTILIWTLIWFGMC